MLIGMEYLEASAALAQAQRLHDATRQAGHWYTRYLLVYAAASFLVAALFGVLGNHWGMLVLMPLWLVVIVALSVWSARARASMVGFGRLHGAVIGSWAVLWAVTVVVGSERYQGRPAWWVPAGVALALPSLVGAWVAHRRTSR